MVTGGDHVVYLSVRLLVALSLLFCVNLYLLIGKTSLHTVFCDENAYKRYRGNENV